MITRNRDNFYVGYYVAYNRNGRTQAILENKLLAHKLLHILGIPTAEISYGAFGTSALGVWPRYERERFVRTLDAAKSKSFVLKSATDGRGDNRIVMSAARVSNPT